LQLAARPPAAEPHVEVEERAGAERQPPGRVEDRRIQMRVVGGEEACVEAVRVGGEEPSLHHERPEVSDPHRVRAPVRVARDEEVAKLVLRRLVGLRRRRRCAAQRGDRDPGHDHSREPGARRPHPPSIARIARQLTPDSTDFAA
jgi:hypothetical protein